VHAGERGPRWDDAIGRTVRPFERIDVRSGAAFSAQSVFLLAARSESEVDGRAVSA
jgi:hypothetical protein